MADRIRTPAGVVDEFDPSGSFLSQGTGEGGWSPEGSGLEGLAFDNATSLAYVADRNNTDLWKLNSNAVVQGSIAGSTSSWAPGTYQCCSIQVDADNTGDAVGGDLYISAQTCCSDEHEGVYRIAPNGAPVPFTAEEPYVEGNHLNGTTGKRDGFFENPVAVAVASNGDIWVAITQRRPLRFDRETAGKGHRIPCPRTVDRRPSNRSDQRSSGCLQRKRLLLSRRPGDLGIQARRFLHRIDRSAVRLREPTRVAVDSAGKLYVADGNKVRVFGRDYPLPSIEWCRDRSDQTSGTLHATVDPGEGGPVASCELEYGTDASYRSTMPCNPDPSSSNFTSPTEVSASLSGLTPEQPYHYRFVVGNTNVTRNGADQVFVPHWVTALKPRQRSTSPQLRPP